jgi:hypothetical protein
LVVLLTLQQLEEKVQINLMHHQQLEDQVVEEQVFMPLLARQEDLVLSCRVEQEILPQFQHL